MRNFADEILEKVLEQVARCCQYWYYVRALSAAQNRFVDLNHIVSFTARTQLMMRGDKKKDARDLYLFFENTDAKGEKRDM